MIKKALRIIKNNIIRRRQIALIRSSTLFDQTWYLKQYPDVARANVDPATHYLTQGAYEGRDPGPAFCSSWYLNQYADIRNAGINPLVHYLRHGQREGREVLPAAEPKHALYRCSVCENQIENFIPISPHHMEEHQKFGNPYGFDDFETIHPLQYSCPFCGASDRDRLYALYLQTAFEHTPGQTIRLLDIAPSQALKGFLHKYPNVQYVSADKYMTEVELPIDVMDMSILAANSFDAFICSHVLEHVQDDHKALQELFRILKVDGFGILMVPINLKIQQVAEDPSCEDVGERIRRFGQSDHVRMYNKAGFMERISRVGFQVFPYGMEYFGKDVFARHGISSKSILYIVKK